MKKFRVTYDSRSVLQALDELPNFIKKLVIPLLQSRKVLFERKIGEILYDG